MLLAVSKNPRSPRSCLVGHSGLRPQVTAEARQTVDGLREGLEEQLKAGSSNLRVSRTGFEGLMSQSLPEGESNPDCLTENQIACR